MCAHYRRNDDCQVSQNICFCSCAFSFTRPRQIEKELRETQKDLEAMPPAMLAALGSVHMSAASRAILADEQKYTSSSVPILAIYAVPHDLYRISAMTPLLVRHLRPKPKQNRSSTPQSKLKPSDYPTNWKEIGIEIRNRARNADGQEQRECRGECLKHHGRFEEINHTWAKHRRRKGKIKIRFTIAHLCHTPKCDDKIALEGHVRALSSDLRSALSPPRLAWFRRRELSHAARSTSRKQKLNMT